MKDMKYWICILWRIVLSCSWRTFWWKLKVLHRIEVIALGLTSNRGIVWSMKRDLFEREPPHFMENTRLCVLLFVEAEQEREREREREREERERERERERMWLCHTVLYTIWSHHQAAIMSNLWKLRNAISVHIISTTF